MESRGFKFSDIVRATAYFRNIHDVSSFNAWFQRERVSPFSFVAVESTICRDELLFEIELDAVS